MEETIKGIEVIAYKGMKLNMTCRNFQYEIGKSYKTDKAELCECGFHACLNPRDVLEYYPQYQRSRYFKVKLSGEIAKCDFEDTKVAATEITILEELTDNFDEVINNIEWWKNENILGLLYWSEGFTKVRRADGLRNFIDKKGNILSDKWFNLVGNFHEGFARVQREDGLWNFIDKKGKYLSEQWFRFIYNFHEDFAIVKRKDILYNFIDKQGNILSNEWFICIGDFFAGFARVLKTNDCWYKIDKDGELYED